MLITVWYQHVSSQEIEAVATPAIKAAGFGMIDPEAMRQRVEAGWRSQFGWYADWDAVRVANQRVFYSIVQHVNSYNALCLYLPSGAKRAFPHFSRCFRGLLAISMPGAREACFSLHSGEDYQCFYDDRSLGAMLARADAKKRGDIGTPGYWRRIGPCLRYVSHAALSGMDAPPPEVWAPKIAAGLYNLEHGTVLDCGFSAYFRRPSSRRFLLRNVRPLDQAFFT